MIDICSTTASSTVKMAVLAPMPTANVSNAITVKPGFLASARTL
jgi:hypothetical protein